MKLVVYGLTITSAWGNGHATTYRSLLRALQRRGHSVVFVEKDVEWYRSNRDLPNPHFCTVHLYDNWLSEEPSLIALARDADVVVVGSYFPDAKIATRALLSTIRVPLFFYDIDTPITMAALRANGECEYLDASLIPEYAAYLSFTGGPILAELEDAFGSPLAVPLYCSVDTEVYHPVSKDARYSCDLSYLGTYAADRQPKLMRSLNETAKLVKHQNFLVAGPMYPKDEAWASNVRRITHVAPPEHPSFYSSARFTLNLTRKDMVEAGFSPSVRLFEAAACGAVVLTDTWHGLSDFFEPGSEILAPDSPQETADILQTMPDDERLCIGGRARERVMSEHTSTHRAQQFEDILSHC